MRFRRARELRFLVVMGVVIAFLAAPISSVACSTSGCLDDGIELRRTFMVRVTHQGAPLPGVHVEITRNGEEDEIVVFSGTSAADGTVHVGDLPAGKYWLDAEYLGITAGYECFHVGFPSSGKAKKKVSYTWGDLAPAIRQVAGRLGNSQPGQGDNALQKLLHPVDVPIGGARLRLQGPSNTAPYSAMTDADGNFSFGPIPNGTYVLHIEAGTTSDGFGYQAVNVLVNRSETSKADRFRLTLGASICGGPTMELQYLPTEPPHEK